MGPRLTGALFTFLGVAILWRLWGDEPATELLAELILVVAGVSAIVYGIPMLFRRGAKPSWLRQ